MGIIHREWKLREGTNSGNYTLRVGTERGN